MFSTGECSLTVRLFVLALVASVYLQGVTPVESEKQGDNQEEKTVDGWEERNPEDKELKDLLPSVLSKVNEQCKDEHRLILIKLLKVSSQVVGGVKYKMEVQVARSNCKKSPDVKVDLKNCKRLEGHPDQILTLEVWEKPWENFLDVTILETKALS